MTAESLVLAYWGYGTDYNPNNLSTEQQNELKNTVLLMHEWENIKMKKVKADAAAYEIMLKQQESNEFYNRSAWDRTTQERDELKNQVKALESIKTGLERSYKEATDKLRDYEALSKHNKDLIVDLNAQREQLKQKDREIETLKREVIGMDGEIQIANYNREAQLSDITDAMREADKMFESAGGGTRHYLRDCFIPILKKRGMIITKLLNSQQNAQECDTTEAESRHSTLANNSLSQIDWKGLEKAFETWIRNRYPIDKTYTRDGEDKQYNLRSSGWNSIRWLKTNLPNYLKK